MKEKSMKSFLKYTSLFVIGILLYSIHDDKPITEEGIEVEGKVNDQIDLLQDSLKLKEVVHSVSEKRSIEDYNFDCRKNPEKSGIISPKPEWDKKFNKYIVDNKRDTVLMHETGSVLTIPKNCFVKNDGSSINGFVTVHYREFHNAMEVALSGIPMNLGDSAQLVSGGMFELRAKKNGTSLGLKEGKEITVNLMSSEKDEEFDHYYLNEGNMAWENKGDLKFDTQDASREIAKDIRWWEFTESYQDQNGFFSKGGGEVVIAVKESERKRFVKWNKRRKGDSKGCFYTIFSKRRFPGEQAYKYLSWKLSDDNSSEDVDRFMKIHDAKNGGSHSVWSGIAFSKCEKDLFYVHFSSKTKDLVLKVRPDAKRYPGENRFIRKQLRLENRWVLKSEQVVNGLFEEAVPVIKSEIIGMNEMELQAFMMNHAIYKNEIEEVILKKLFKLPSAELPYRAEIRTTRLGVHNIDSKMDIPSALIAGLKKAPKLGCQYFNNKLSKREKRKYERSLISGYPLIDDEKRDLSTVAKIVLINEGVNTLNEFNGKAIKQDFRFLKKEKCLGLVFMLDGSVRLIEPKQFKKQKKNSPFLKFDTELCEDETELAELLSNFNYNL